MKASYLVAGGVLLALAALFSLVNLKTERTRAPVSRFDHAHGMGLDPLDAQKLYVATHDGLYLLENDTELFRIGTSRDDLMGFTTHPSKSGAFFSSGHAARGGNLGLQRTDDGGMTWERVSAGLNGPVDFHAMTVSTVNPEVIYGFDGRQLQRSGDGGRTWEYTRGVVAPISLTSDPIQEHTVYAATQNGVLVSEDQGDSWKSLSAELEGGVVSAFALNPSKPKTAMVFAERLNGLGRSTDGGVTWQRISESFDGRSILYLSFSKSEPDTVYALTASNSIHKSMDGGSTWSLVR